MKILKNGTVIVECQPNSLHVVLAQLNLGPADVTLEYTDDEKKAAVRQQINQVADPASREGVVSDVLGVVAVGLAQLSVALNKAQTLADVRAAAQPLAEIGATVDEAVSSGALKLPFMVKAGGAHGVLADLMKISNGVTAVLAPQHSEQPA